MKKILLPTDFSKNAFNAISYGLQLFKDDECTFYLLNTYTPRFYRVDYLIGGPPVSTIPDMGVDLSLEGLKRTRERVEKEFPNPKHQFKTISVFNTLTAQIQETCESEQIAMVIMGTQGASGAEEFFLGSNTVHVIRKSDCPVLAVPEDYTFKGIDQILFPTDYASKYKIEELEPLQQMALKFNAVIHVVHAVEDDDITARQLKNKAFLKEQLKEYKVVFQDVTKQYMPNVVHNYTDKNQIDLIVMMNKRHSFLDRLLLKQNVDVIGYSSSVPFLVLRDTSEIIK
ncbi:universal stress protein [uncultured Croceitalea sp.]|uniref:universal stress protein n=1 Tax=uncultured Croceitalea sp. TaxID=1798908 RepID=UPI003305A85C